MRDLVDTLVRERLFGFADGVRAGEGYRVGQVAFRVREGDGLQPVRYAGGPVWYGDREVAPDELLRLVAAGEPHVERVAADVRTAVEHAKVVLDARHGLTPVGLLAGERLAATRNRPFHPTARAAAGWTRADLAEYGPLRREPLPLRWVAVDPAHVRFGGGADSRRLADVLLRGERPAAPDGRVLIPVHPWQFEHVLPGEFAAELDAGIVTPLPEAAGSCTPTASLRTLATPDPARHVKLPLGIATLGSARLLPPRYLGNGERAEHLLRGLLDRDRPLRELVAICDERSWCAIDGDEFADRPGQLAAQLRGYPRTPPGTVTVPMAALAAHEWDSLGVLAPRGPLAFFHDLALGFTAMALGFLRHGVLPELHGQNVLVTLRDGAPVRFVLRDHDTVRLCPRWMASAGVPDPGYRVRPGAPQSLSLDSGTELVGYLQTLGLQVNLHGVADALARHHGLAERVFWQRLREALRTNLGRIPLPPDVERLLLREPEWPGRDVLGPLLRQGPSAGVSMPAATGRVPNPLRAV
ncbi:siderophore synthetase component [Prauserella shujinwangii]|uniref:Siderophore synthetase component n=1 Tax=Prauserella shujinwangii TaxID=1453103 RepID=A0A2T0M191_9PSEU|nr:IucA/IucC family protein [Prauserella shujinwangii]PRX50353.1 siderophore synthetase component [Prauserella shujinwangii]